MDFLKALFSKTALKQLVFVLILFALLIPTALWDSNSQVKLRYHEDHFRVTSDRYDMTIYYADIVSAELTDLKEPGEDIADARDDKIIRVGVRKNEAWGEYIIVADMDCTNCVVLTLHDGRTLVFSHKNDKATAEAYDTLLTHLN